MKLAGRTVLIVEDEPIIGLALEDMLSEAGALPVFADSLEAGGEILATEHIDAAVLDVNIHGQPSYPVAQVLEQKGVPFIFASGYGNSLHPVEFAAIPTITKPYTLADIQLALTAAAERKPQAINPPPVSRPRP